MIGAGTASAPSLVDFKREIRRLHGCTCDFERIVTVPESPGRARRAVAIFALHGHPALRCFAWAERREDGIEVVAVLRSLDIRGPEDAVRHVADVERASRDRWAQEYA